MYTPRTSVEAIPNASIHHSALQNRDFGHTYDRSRALVRALDEYTLLSWNILKCFESTTINLVVSWAAYF